MRANGRRDALVPAALREGMHSRLHACFGLLRVEKRAQLFLVGLRQVLAHDGNEPRPPPAYGTQTLRRVPKSTRDCSH